MFNRLAGPGALALSAWLAAGAAAQWPAVSGDAVLAALGQDLDRVALEYQVTPDELRQVLQRDPSLQLHPNGRLYYVDPPAPQSEETAGQHNRLGIPVEDAFTLQSNPGADRVVYLDFDGHHSVNNDWGHDIVFPPYNTQGAPETFTNFELNQIIDIWQYMAEDFAPFDVNVTTAEPDPDYLSRLGRADPIYGVRCVFTQHTDGFLDGAGGVAFIGAFNDNKDNPVFAFNKGVNNGAITGSHEVGHAVGLWHDGLDELEYHPGVGSGQTSWGPIMGAPWGKSVVTWSNGDYAGSTSVQDDLVVAGSFGAPLKADDHGAGIPTATILAGDCNTPTALSADGLIETPADTDVFRVTSLGGEFTATVLPLFPFGNLDARLELYDAGGVLLAEDDPNSYRAASVTYDGPAGAYYLRIDGTGATWYSDYGSLGVYELSVTGGIDATGCAGDADGDCDVDLSDLGTVLAEFGQSGAGLAGDIDGDGSVGISDLAVVLGNFGLICG